MYISYDFQLEYFVHQDPACDFLISLYIYIYIYIYIYTYSISYYHSQMGLNREKVNNVILWSSPFRSEGDD